MSLFKKIFSFLPNSISIKRSPKTNVFNTPAPEFRTFLGTVLNDNLEIERNDIILDKTFLFSKGIGRSQQFYDINDNKLSLYGQEIFYHSIKKVKKEFYGKCGSHWFRLNKQGYPITNGVFDLEDAVSIEKENEASPLNSDYFDEKGRITQSFVFTQIKIKNSVFDVHRIYKDYKTPSDLFAVKMGSQYNTINNKGKLLDPDNGYFEIYYSKEHDSFIGSSAVNDYIINKDGTRGIEI